MAEFLRWGELERSIEAIRENLDNPKILHPFAKRLQQRAKDFIAADGEGAWPPYAASTRKRMERTGDSNITKHGEIRRSKLTRVEQQIQAVKGRIDKSGWGDKERKKVAQLQKRMALLQRQRNRPGALRGAAEQLWQQAAQLRTSLKAARDAGNVKEAAKLQRKLLSAEGRALVAGNKAAAYDYQNVKIGKRLSERRKLMGRMPGTIRAKVRRSGNHILVRVYSAAGDVAYYHHEGEGNNPKRKLIPDPTSEDMDFLADLLEGAAGEAYENS